MPAPRGFDKLSATVSSISTGPFASCPGNQSGNFLYPTRYIALGSLQAIVPFIGQT